MDQIGMLDIYFKNPDNKEIRNVVTSLEPAYFFSKSFVSNILIYTKKSTNVLCLRKY